MKSNITQGLKGYAEKAIDTLYNVAVDTILTKVASMDFAGSYFKNSAVPEYDKFRAARRNIIRDDSAILGLTDYPTGKPGAGIGWKEIAEAGMVMTAALGGLAIAKKYDLGMDDVDAGIAFAKAEIAGASGLFGGIDDYFKGNEPSAADIVKKYNIPVANASDMNKVIVDEIIVNESKQPRTDVKVILGTSDDEDVLPEMIHVAKYLNKSQRVPNENIKILNSSEFTYENFLRTMKEVGVNAFDTDTLIINPSSDGNGIGFTFSKEGLKFNKKDARTFEYRTYKIIAEDIKNNTNPKTKKIILVDACLSGSAIPAFREVGIPNSAVLTSSTETAEAPASSSLNGLLTGIGVPHKDYSNDGNVSLNELFQSSKKEHEDSYNKYMPNEPMENRHIPQIWDTENITDELVLVDR